MVYYERLKITNIKGKIDYKISEKGILIYKMYMYIQNKQ